MKGRILIAVVVASVGLSGRALHAQTLREATVPLSTTGSFICSSAVFVTGSCSASGNSLLLTSGGATLSLLFTGTSGSIVAANDETRTVGMGTITALLGGEGPLFFPTLIGQSPIFRLALAITSGLPIPQTRTKFQAFFSNGGSSIVGDCCTGGSNIAFVSGPPGYAGYPTLVYSNFRPINLSGSSETVQLQASVGIVPEPSTFILMVTGLVGVVGFAYRRRVR